MSAAVEGIRAAVAVTPRVPREEPAVVVVGGGPVGLRFALDFNRGAPDRPLVVYGDEVWQPYDRVRLSAYLAGETDRDGLELDRTFTCPDTVEFRHHLPVTAIDPRARAVMDATGSRQRYAHLVLATGSRPFVPALPGIDLPGVYTFRDLADAERLYARRVRSRHTVVLGGGLLGLETARAMQGMHTQVTVIEHTPWLMNRQLDEEAGALLRAHVEGRGIRVLTDCRLEAVLGGERVVGVRLADGAEIPCDTLVVAAGIRPRIELARQAGLAVGRGVRVDDGLTTSDPHIHAIGECAEHRGVVHGLVAPGWDQAAVLARRLAGGRARYLGNTPSARLKVLDYPVASAGVTGAEGDAPRGRAWVYREGASYHKLFVDRDRLVGCISLGEWPDLARVQEAVARRRRVWPWQLRRFQRTGSPWPPAADAGVVDWPDDAVVCNCTGVTRGRLGIALGQGCRDLASLRAATGAASVCGSCQPLVAELAGAPGIEPVPGRGPLWWSSLVALALALAVLLPVAVPYPDSVAVPVPWDQLWRDGLLKQVSGFTLLGLGVLASVLALRKRVPRWPLGDFAWWRVAHGVVGVLAVLALTAHTGLRLGHQLNALLMITFAGLLLAGAVAGGVIALQDRIPLQLGRRVRRAGVWLHILLLWPLPALLGFHVLKTYWY